MNKSKTKYKLITKTTQDNRRVYVVGQPPEKVRESTNIKKTKTAPKKYESKLYSPGAHLQK